MTAKRCSKCQTIKPVSEFYKNKSKPGGLSRWCKSCSKAAAKVYRKTYPEKHRERNKKYYQQHPENARERAKRYYYQHPEKARDNVKKYAQQHPEKTRETKKRYKQRYPEKIQEGRKRYREEHPEIFQEASRRRRARKEGRPGAFTQADLQRQLEIQGGLCFWCSEPLLKNWEPDHVIPVRHPKCTNSPENIVCSCADCNRRKNAKLPYLEWQPHKPLQPWHPILDSLSNESEEENLKGM